MTAVAAADLDHGALLQQCAAGDRRALQALYQAEAPRMKAVARRMLRRDEIAEDAVQDAFVRIWHKASQYDPERGSALGWIYTVQRSVALNLLRGSRHEDLVEPADFDAIQERRQEIHTAEEVWGRLDASGRLRTCLGGLEPARRKVVLLAYAYGLSHGEIAGRLARPLGTVKAWLRRSLESLRECMK
ncbi:RNA polymerase sigma-70 factor (ECF subfamily) [Hoeflea marina]|uniref:RNA polymerase sigma-70 factor (ECF subfamily) n=1 Tax=Hoeflea marina TaxID=274592 RepID=A0A317PFD7_9HYPH|nr:sigma-70 family RNA polymerase sigma factor [Hoeflea marina]PWV97514.1 RNA polymerase sigma-70 factor (ECF subfamily) [Hoeflea marina]